MNNKPDTKTTLYLITELPSGNSKYATYEHENSKIEKVWFS
jgi:hypothetical protein